jgi:glycosyltransferase involved in cell wall biosynthesis
MLHIAGIVGLPGNYGGFETLADHLLDSTELIQQGVVVHCELGVFEKQGSRYKGAQLHPLRWRANGWQSILYDTAGLWHASRQGGVVLMLGTSATFWLPLLRHLFPNVRYIVNMAGLEWARAKWGALARSLLKYNEAAAARHAHVLIADNQGLVDYVRQTYGREPVLIAYGGDQFLDVCADESVFEGLNLPASYDFAMARAQIDNNMEIILAAYVLSGLPLVFVSNWDSTAYGRAIRSQYCGHRNIKMIGPIYEIAKVKALHGRVRAYVHGHSAGGTNPVLVEAMWAGLPTLAFDVSFNRYTTHGQAHYFHDHEDLARISVAIEPQDLQTCGQTLRRIAQDHYSWRSIRAAYERVIMAKENAL